MKKLLISLLALGSISAYSSVIYKCLYSHTIFTSSSMIINNDFNVNFNEDGLRINDLNIEIKKKKIIIQHLRADKVIKESIEAFGIEDFSFSSFIKERGQTTGLEIACKRKEPGYYY